MTLLNNLFGKVNISWKKLILMAVVCGVVSGLLLCIPFLEGTSLENIGVCFEGWIFLALIIILNSEKPLEAALKTFVFFLVSQPIIYLVQVPFSWLHWQIFMYYKRWFIFTLLTLPGGFIAWFTKKGNVLSMLILAVADGLLMFMEFPMHLLSLIHHFPHQLIALCFILASSAFYTLYLLKDKKLRIASFAIKLIFLIAGIFYYL